MHKKWSVEQPPELIPALTDSKDYKERVAEIAEVLYSYFCQLEDQSRLIGSDSYDNLGETRRLGTDA